jgi:5'-nucleotidase
VELTKDPRQLDLFNPPTTTKIVKEQSLSRKPILLFDMDGVMANYYGRFLELWRSIYTDREFIPEGELKTFYLEDSYREEYREDIRELTTSCGFFRGIKPISGSIETLRKILSDGIFEPFICSSPEVEAEEQCCFSEKAQWVEDHLGREWTERLILTKDKTLVYGDFLIDDKPVIKGINHKKAWTRVVFDQSYNKGVIGPRLNGWADWDKLEPGLLRMFKNMQILEKVALKRNL